MLEASGGYAMPLAAALQVAGLPVAVVKPRQARDFATATGRLAQMDKLDAASLAHFAAAVRPAPRPVVDPDVRHRDALLARRQQLIGLRVMESNRLGTVTDPAVRAGLDRHLAWLEAELAEADKQLGGIDEVFGRLAQEVFGGGPELLHEDADAGFAVFQDR